LGGWGGGGGGGGFRPTGGEQVTAWPRSETLRRKEEENRDEGFIGPEKKEGGKVTKAEGEEKTALFLGGRSRRQEAAKEEMNTHRARGKEGGRVP